MADGSDPQVKAPPRSSYILPSHPSEIDRLDLQHYALREAMGCDYLAPITSPGRILDAGSGTGQWCFDLCAEYPDALVVGLDLQASKPYPPSNYAFLRSNLITGLPFCADAFDFIHQRFVTTGVPLSYWAELIADLVRATRPDGWVELAEPRFEILPAGPATSRFFKLSQRGGRSLGLDMQGAVFDTLEERLERAGLRHVDGQRIYLPIGEWGGRVGSLMATDCRAVATRMAPVLQSRLGVPAGEMRQLITSMTEEWEENHSSFAFAIAYGRKAQ